MRVEQKNSQKQGGSDHNTTPMTDGGYGVVVFVQQECVIFRVTERFGDLAQ